MCNAHINFSDTKKIKWIMGGKTKFYPKLKLVNIMKTQPKFDLTNTIIIRSSQKLVILKFFDSHT